MRAFVTFREPDADGEGCTYWSVELELPEGWRDTARVVARGSCAPYSPDTPAHEPWGRTELDEHDYGRSSWWDRDADDGSTQYRR